MLFFHHRGYHLRLFCFFHFFLNVFFSLSSMLSCFMFFLLLCSLFKCSFFLLLMLLWISSFLFLSYFRATISIGFLFFSQTIVTFAFIFISSWRTESLVIVHAISVISSNLELTFAVQCNEFWRIHTKTSKDLKQTRTSWNKLEPSRKNWNDMELPKTTTRKR